MPFWALPFNELAGRSAFERLLLAADFEAITAVRRLDIEHVAPRHAKYALDGSRHVFMHSVGKLDHDHRPFTRCAYEAPRDGTGSATELVKHDLHGEDGSTGKVRV